jgi:hypothetical protein
MDISIKKYWIWDAILFPFWWYRTIINLWHPFAVTAIKKSPKSIESLNYSIWLSVCHCDRRYIDDIRSEVDIDQMSSGCQQQAYFDIGMALCDLGYRDEGVDSIIRAAAINDGLPGISRAIHYQLCCRLSEKKYWAKRLECAFSFNERFPQNKELTKRMLAKAYIDLGQFDKAENEINELVKLRSYNNIFWADFYYSQGDNKSAAEIFKKYKLDDSQDYWHAQYDYKEAVAYFNADQWERWQKKAKAIGRRLAWDKFYNLDYLESEGVERIAEIDIVIDASRNQKRLIYPDKMLLILKRIPWFLWKTILIYRYLLLCLLILALFFVMLFLDWLRYLKDKVGAE